jgi:hypothetical protein
LTARTALKQWWWREKAITHEDCRFSPTNTAKEPKEIEFLMPIDKAIFQDGEQVIGP